MTLSQEALARASKISLIILDADGVLTDGRIIYAEHGDELKCFDVQDGAALVFWHKAGLKSAIISGRKSKTLVRRAKEMRIDFLAQGKQEKLPVYYSLLKKFRLTDEQVCVICDDMMELPMARRAGFVVSVPSAAKEIQLVSHYITHRQGGRGAVREAVEILLKAKGLWEQTLHRYE